jgi:hypothetical protein
VTSTTRGSVTARRGAEPWLEGAYALRQRLSTSASNPTVYPLIVYRSCAEMEWCRTRTGTVMEATMSIRVYSLFTDRRVFELTVRRGAGLFVHAGRFELAWNSQGFVVCRGMETVVHWG